MMRVSYFVALLLLLSTSAQATRLDEGQISEYGGTLNATCIVQATQSPVDGMTPDDAPAICACQASKVNDWLKTVDFDEPANLGIGDLAKITYEVTKATYECLTNAGKGKIRQKVVEGCVKLNAENIKANSDPAFAAQYVQTMCQCTGRRYMEIYDPQAIAAQADDTQMKKVDDRLVYAIA